ncbi:MAG: acetyl-CoA C-acetyltransferase [Chloroflexi bacterium]|nr:acetyl-CoA C-acetyltransferase [Chloroflexota bacterium]
MDREAVIVGAARVPNGRFLGALSALSAPDLGAIAIREAMRRANVPANMVDEVIMGNVISAGVGQAPARQAALRGGIPDDVSAMTINKVCGSGLQAVMLAAQAIRAGDAKAIVAGGMESMSRAPYLVPKARTGYRLGNAEMIDSVVYDGLWCAFEDEHMGCLAEYIAGCYGVTREEMDELSLRSHQRAVKATEGGRFREEIVPVEIGDGANRRIVDRDEPPRGDTSLTVLAALPPAFVPGGKVTAGNSPGLSDGGAAVVVMSQSAAQKAGATPMARITGYASAAIEPKRIFAAPTLAVRKLLQRTGYRLEGFDLLEINEAFAAQILANHRELEWDWEKANVNGGSIALGHPIGASGARILVTLLYALRARGGQRGLAALCLGGGGAVAMSVEML